MRRRNLYYKSKIEFGQLLTKYSKYKTYNVLLTRKTRKIENGFRCSDARKINKLNQHHQAKERINSE